MPLSNQIYRLLKLSIAAALPIITYPLPGSIHYRVTYNFFGNNGYVIMKLGQWLATRTDLISIKMCEVLSALHSKAPAHSLEDTLKVLKSEGFDPLALKFMDPDPIGSGTIAQVYKVTFAEQQKGFSFYVKNFLPVLYQFKSEGLNNFSKSGNIQKIKDSRHKTFAIKITHPNTINNIFIDCQILRNVGKALNNFPFLSFLDITEQVLHFQQEMLKQVDLTEEERNMKVMRHLIRFNRNVVIAQPIISTKNVLVMEYLEGIPIKSFFSKESTKKVEKAPQGEIKNPGLVRRIAHSVSKNRTYPVKNTTQGYPEPMASYLTSTALHFFLKSLFFDRFIHTDLHPGNFAVSKTKKLIIYDLGLAKFLFRSEHQNFVDLFCALLIDQNGWLVGDLLVNRFACNRNVNLEDFRLEMNDLVGCYFENIYRKVNDKTPKEDFKMIKRHGLRTIRLFNKYNVKIDNKYNHLFVTALCLDGILRQIDPNCTFYEELNKALWIYGPTAYFLKRLVVKKITKVLQ